MRKILYISGTRADYGLMRPVLEAIEKHTELELAVAVTGMHLMPEFGMTIGEVKKDGFTLYELDAKYEKDNKESTARFIGKLIQLLTKKIKKIKPDIILVLGDRGEMLAGAIVGAYLGIPVAHFRCGEVTSTIDEVVRHTITKLSHIHLPATEKAKERIIKMGEEPWRVFVVGDPGLDSILSQKLPSREEIAKKYELDLFKPLLLVIQHSVTKEFEQARQQIKETLEAVKEMACQTIIIYPNADAGGRDCQTIIIYPNADVGGREMIEKIEQYRELPFIKIYKNLSHNDFLGLMSIAGAMIGNSSSGITEAPCFHLPVVNIGTRQEGRETAGNTIDVNYDKEQIKFAIKQALFDEDFKEKVKNCQNPYGDGKTSQRVVKFLSELKIDKKLLYKKITY